MYTNKSNSNENKAWFRHLLCHPVRKWVRRILLVLELGLDRYRSGARYPIPDTIGHSCTDTDTGNDITYSLGQTYLTYVARSVCTFQNIINAVNVTF